MAARTALVTGGTDGIGLHTACGLATDHHDTGRLPGLAKANPGARVVTVADTDDSVTAGGAVVRVRHGDHAVVS